MRFYTICCVMLVHYTTSQISAKLAIPSHFWELSTDTRQYFHISFSAKETWRKENSRLIAYGDKLLIRSLHPPGIYCLDKIKDFESQLKFLLISLLTDFESIFLTLGFIADLYRRTTHGEFGLGMRNAKITNKKRGFPRYLL
ncbi:MAG: hypothetical protein ACD_56C00076G0004 [uncultured bacterium]|nr:MAG: hypothetical protein ACD_56C00076G0004 [uncultured bacterium]